ncbi:ligand-binding sensor domain-containing protein [Aurantibacillus circumpalustris]|uniref:ligand-binding sensor domain-containing protein n=1 Tax=Aurantibacillus circumpalustris TaxID=3036359 RepID=UPI00295AFDA9|nr:two-component regulator propeller domain-containing protein [Aurantibacillus circumpalustris]
MKKNIILYLSLLLGHFSFCQKYNFVNWTVEDGLIQSQASYICQDNYRQLWIGTEGGICRFDGKKFIGYTVQDGLAANQINALFCDKLGNLWIGTNSGISYYNGSKFTTVSSINKSANNVSEIVQLSNGDLYAIGNYNLLYIKKFQSKKVFITGDSTEKITDIYQGSSNNLLVSVHKKGIYALDKSTWRQISKYDEIKKNIYVRAIFITASNDTLIGTNKGLYYLINNKIEIYKSKFKILDEINVLCITEDSKENIWLGTENGCYRLNNDEVIHFDEKSGFTDNSVNHIYKDIENNLWFATNADGIYKFRENTFTYYDKSCGLPSAIVMGVVQRNDKTIFAAGYGGGLYKINSDNNIETVSFLGKKILEDSKINCLYSDDEDNILIGTLNNGAYRFNEKTGLQKMEAINNSSISIRGATIFLKDLQGNILIGTNQGLFLRDKNTNITSIKNTGHLITSIKQFDETHLIVGTSSGIFLLDKNYKATPFHEKYFGDASVLCLSKNNNSLWVGTTDKGVFNLNYKTNRVITYTSADGLPSNFIYSIDVSEDNKVWVGTGFGISNLQLSNEGKVLAVKNYGRSDGLFGMECNHNCLLKAVDSSLWFGTTKGLFHFNPNTKIAEKNQPFVLLRSVKLFSSLISDSSLFEKAGSWFNAPQGLKLFSKQNHLTFELGSIYFTNPEDVLYKYKLEGIDKVSTISNNPYIIYPALPPGKYTLIVTGLTKGGAVSSNEINYSFEIKKAFYQTRFFQLVIILLLLATGALLAYVFTRGKQKRKQKAKEVLEKIREEEFMKLRQRTAEDFHDEMGNSLTRISVLTDVLKSKINGKEQEITHLVSQIRENTKALYSGSKDIIWSLNSKNDGLYEIVEHIKDIGTELFQETNVDFIYTHSIESTTDLKLKLDYSRNLTMIFKEAYSNILKHSNANEVSIQIYLNSMNELVIIIYDNGHGFNMNSVIQGNGLKNMKNRAMRMNGNMTHTSILNKGTELQFILKSIFI